ncbi:Fur family transcriptional regulator [Pantoea sp. 18069]|uniref:Fur family transcriptional regulator n=1 Tax=Pantoea sp. 18069 TaxID=2681415 RepID=UPI00135B0DBE|nr:Fur family transcriptional regulator [Pantoea sp. 18069]
MAGSASAESAVNASLMQRLRKAGLRATTARIAMLQAIEAAAEGLTAEDVFRQLPQRGASASLSTVYRVMHRFAQAGLLQRGWDERGTAFYRIHSAECIASFQLVCGNCHHSIHLTDSDLHAWLLAAARREGLASPSPAQPARASTGSLSARSSEQGRQEFSAKPCA